MQCLTQFDPYYEPRLCPHTIYPLITHNNALHALGLECFSHPTFTLISIYLFITGSGNMLPMFLGDPAIVKIGNICLLAIFPSPTTLQAVWGAGPRLIHVCSRCLAPCLNWTLSSCSLFLLNEGNMGRDHWYSGAVVSGWQIIFTGY